MGRPPLAQITGYRKDRLGARIIALGNLLFLEDKFGASVKYLWPDSFESHDMAVDNADHPIFADDFQKKYITQISDSQKPDFGDATDLDQIRGNIGSEVFKERIATGETFICKEGLQPLLFSNEVGAKHISEFRKSMERMEFSEVINDMLNKALSQLKERGETPTALHFRRGDVLDVAPWCHKNWVSKYCPDEFYEEIMKQPKVSALLFSDVPEAAKRLAGDRDNAVTLNDLLDTPHLSEMQRDLVELLLMAKCATIVAPSLSAFSASASLISGSEVSKLPSCLPLPVREAAYDRLLARTLNGPESFHNTGDFAQSIGYAFGHALKRNKHAEFYDLMKDSLDAGHPFASYLPLTMALALANGDTQYAQNLHFRAKSDPNIWKDDRLICDSLSTIAMHQAGEEKKATTEFLNQFLARRKTVLNLDSIASYFFVMEPEVGKLFMLDDVTKEALQLHRIFLFPDDPEIFNGAMTHAYPFWLIGSDWAEMFESQQVIKNVTKDPPFPAKRVSFPAEIRQAEADFFQSNNPLPTDAQAVALLSAMSVAFALSGRYRRATAIMFHCRKHDSENPLYFKRLANRFVATEQWDKAERNLERALNLAPGHPGLILAQAQVAQAQGQHHKVDRLLNGIVDQEWLPFSVFKTWEKSLRQLKSKAAKRNVIALAAKRFEGHQIFEKQWSGKL